MVHQGEEDYHKNNRIYEEGLKENLEEVLREVEEKRNEVQKYKGNSSYSKAVEGEQIAEYNELNRLYLKHAKN